MYHNVYSYCLGEFQGMRGFFPANRVEIIKTDLTPLKLTEQELKGPEIMPPPGAAIPNNAQDPETSRSRASSVDAGILILFELVIC